MAVRLPLPPAKTQKKSPLLIKDLTTWPISWQSFYPLQQPPKRRNRVSCPPTLGYSAGPGVASG